MMKKYPLSLILVLLILFSCKQKETTQETERENWWLWTANWKPNGEQIAMGGTQDTLRLFSSADNKLLKNYPFEGIITKSKWHPIKNKLAISMQGDKAKSLIFFPDSGKSIELDSLDVFGARAIGWNKTGELLAVGDYSGFLTIYNENGEILKRVDSGQKSLIGLDWHPEKDLLVAVGDVISIYDYENDAHSSINPRKEEVLMLCVAWHPDGELFVTGDYGDFEKDYPPLLQFWSANGEKISEVRKSKSEYRNIKWSSDGKYLATASNFIGLWTKEGKLEKEKIVENLIWGIDWNTENDKIVTTHEKGKIIIWDSNLNQINELTY